MKKLLKPLLLLVVGISLVGCADDIARSQSYNNTQELVKVNNRLTLLERRVSNQNNLDLLNQVDNIQTQLSQVRGNLQNISNAQSKSANNYKLFYQTYSDKMDDISKELDDLKEQLANVKASEHNIKSAKVASKVKKASAVVSN